MLERAKGIEPSYAAWEGFFLLLILLNNLMILFGNCSPIMCGMRRCEAVGDGTTLVLNQVFCLLGNECELTYSDASSNELKTLRGLN